MTADRLNNEKGKLILDIWTRSAVNHAIVRWRSRHLRSSHQKLWSRALALRFMNEDVEAPTFQFTTSNDKVFRELRCTSNDTVEYCIQMTFLEIFFRSFLLGAAWIEFNLISLSVEKQKKFPRHCVPRKLFYIVCGFGIIQRPLGELQTLFPTCRYKWRAARLMDSPAGRSSKHFRDFPVKFAQ